MLFVDLLLQVLNVTGPVFVLVILGLLLRRTRVVDDPFVQQASTLVFNAEHGWSTTRLCNKPRRWYSRRLCLP